MASENKTNPTLALNGLPHPEDPKPPPSPIVKAESEQINNNNQAGQAVAAAG